MVFGVVLAFCAAVCMGTATVLQAMGARMTATGEPSAARLGTLVPTLRRWPFLAGVALDTLGFVAELAALRSLPLFVVEAALASSLAVTAVVAAGVLRIRLRRAEWCAVAAVCCGLALLAVAAGHEGTGEGDAGMRLVVLCLSLGLALLGWAAAARHVLRRRAAVLGAVAGLNFGLVAVAVRLLPGLDVRQLLTAPSTYAVIASGLVGYLLLIEALRSGSVTAATAAMVIGETAWPAVFGVVWLGDTTRRGLAPLAAVGFAASVAGALALARFGEAEQHAGAT
ncbi:hypothetical protein AB0F13_13580 [Streptomyces sp. NPDC026206]|uniref:hypothetical protein n=1 Tax=Streptomyces sp. NPDC026206 TaxID=3157089 RepID=UPI00340217C7